MPPTTKVPSTTKKSRPGAGAATVPQALVRIVVPAPAAGAPPKKIRKKAFGRLRATLEKAVRAAADEGLAVELDLAVLEAAAGRGVAPAGVPVGRARTAPAPRPDAGPPARSRKSAGARAQQPPAAPPAVIPPARPVDAAAAARAPRRALRRTPARPPAPPTT